VGGFACAMGCGKGRRGVGVDVWMWGEAGNQAGGRKTGALMGTMDTCMFSVRFVRPYC